MIDQLAVPFFRALCFTGPINHDLALTFKFASHRPIIIPNMNTKRHWLNEAITYITCTSYSRELKLGVGAMMSKSDSILDIAYSNWHTSVSIECRACVRGAAVRLPAVL